MIKNKGYQLEQLKHKKKTVRNISVNTIKISENARIAFIFLFQKHLIC